MQNGHDKQQAHMQNINPMQAAVYALQFLEAVPHTRAQREAYDIAMGMLQAIASGQVILAPPPQAMPAEALDVKTAQ